MKGLPVIGTAIGALTMPVVSAGATWVIGKVFIQHFASGGTLLDFNPPDYREFIKTQREKLGSEPPTLRSRRCGPAARHTRRAPADPQRGTKGGGHNDWHI